MILGSTHEVAGYVGRIILYINPWSFVAFIIQISRFLEVDSRTDCAWFSR